MRIRKECANCGHHVSVHEYKPQPDGLGNRGPQDCRLCPCTEFVRPRPYERIRRQPMTKRDKFMGRDMSVLTEEERHTLMAFYEIGLERACNWLGKSEVEVENTRLDALMKLGLEEVIAAEERSERA